MSQLTNKKKNILQSGFTVVELMIGLLLSLMLMIGVVQVYMGSKTTYRVTEGLSRLQENTRSSAEMLAKDIRMAGYIPCSQPQNSASIINANDWWAQIFEQPIRGFEGEINAVGFPAEIIDEVAPGTDALVVVRSGNKVAGVKLFDQVNNQFILQRAVEPGWVDDGSLMVVCDSTNARLFQASAINTSSVTVADIGAAPSPGNAGSIARDFGSDAQLANYSAVIYYIRNSSNGDGFSLYRSYLNVNGAGDNVPLSEELAAGIENMQLLYGYDSDGDGNAERYLKASNPIFNVLSNWRNVATVKIGLLYASADGLREGADLDNTVYVVANTEIGTNTDVTHTADRRKRYVASMTVSLRNL